MEWKIKCPWCNQEHIIDSSCIGKNVKCKSCDQEFKARITNVGSPLANSFVNHTRFDSPPKKTINVQQNKNCQHQSSITSSNPTRNPQIKSYRANKIWIWVQNFFDFKVIVIPAFVRGSFLLLFVSGTISILVYPFNDLCEKVDERKISDILFFVMCYFALLFVVVPLWALVLHAFYELTMIPFLILDTLHEIRNKLDEKAFITSKSILQCLLEIRDKLDEKKSVTKN